ncbi:hypothetical protein DEJ13_00920 [Curtobacterium sp. MCLR17_007]|uniref:hypothetical protein n=1 Tax=Curtobacterium sp. MCLR17_007 TaxID=2175648 RepID=UPI0011B79B7B|nr:hypothetical protein [Curtobacterium sp. MCLR17_007]WIB60417.1 hypothetical protein DEJ13_00920 [Curtobacterium sp. MCLR17_007]
MPPASPSDSESWEGKAPRTAGPQVTDPVLVGLLEAIHSGSLRPSEAMALTRDHIRTSRPNNADDATATRAIALADAAHGAEGIAVIDPYAREVARWVAEGRMSGDEAVAFVDALVDAGAYLADLDGQPGAGYQAAIAQLGVDPMGGVERGDVRKPVRSARRPEDPQSEDGRLAKSVTSAPSDLGAAQFPSDSGLNTLFDRIGPFYDAAGLRDSFHISSEAVDAQVRSGGLIAVVTADGFRLFPAFQFNAVGRPLPRLHEVLAGLDPTQVDPWGDAVWLNAPSDDLDGLTPAATLRTARADDVIRLARQAGAFRFG